MLTGRHDRAPGKATEDQQPHLFARSQLRSIFGPMHTPSAAARPRARARRRPWALAAPLLALAACATSPAARPVAGPTAGPTSAPLPTVASLPALDSAVRARIAAVPGARVGVVYHDRTTDERLDVDGDSLFHAASTMKVPVLIELFRRVDAGTLSLDDSVPVVNRFASIVDGSPYALDAGDDSDSSMYARIGSRVPLRELAEHMITRSSNLATNIVIDLLGARRVDSTTHALGATRTRVYRGVEDEKAFEAGLNNVTTAADLATLLEAIDEGRAASRASCDSMRAILLRQHDNAQIPAGLPPGTPVAHKTGQITAVLHDAAIVYPPGRAPYALVVLTRGIPDEAVARRLIVDITRLVNAYAMRQGERRR